MRKILVLQSGGMDSAVVLALAMKKFDQVATLSFDYGQSHNMSELHAAQKLRQHYKEVGFPFEWYQRELDLEPFSRSALLNPGHVHDESFSSAPPDSGIAPTWLPARNAILLSVAAGFAYCREISVIGTGVNAIDWSGYPDCTPRFTYALEHALKLGLARPDFEIYAPLVDRTKKDIVLLGEELKVPWELTWSCYEGGGVPCQKCGACKVRAIGFDQAGVKDPLIQEMEETV